MLKPESKLITTNNLALLLGVSRNAIYYYEKKYGLKREVKNNTAWWNKNDFLLLIKQKEWEKKQDKSTNQLLTTKQLLGWTNASESTMRKFAKEKGISPICVNNGNISQKLWKKEDFSLLKKRQEAYFKRR